MPRSAKPEKPSKPQPGWLNKQDMAASCGVSLTAFDKWQIEPVAKIGRNTYFRVVDVLDNRKARWSATLAIKQASEIAPLPAALEAEQEKMLLTREQRIGQELKNAQTRREVAPVSLLTWALSQLGAKISAHLEAVPQHLKKLHPALPARAIEDVKREIVKAQNIAARVTVDLDEYYERDPEGD